MSEQVENDRCEDFHWYTVTTDLDVECRDCGQPASDPGE